MIFPIFIVFSNELPRMLKQNLHLKLLQKLSPQQIQLMKLLQVPAASMEQRIKEELEINPALEEGDEEELELDDIYLMEDKSDDDDSEFDKIEDDDDVQGVYTNIA
mgnify:CR=1 FL=1